MDDKGCEGSMSTAAALDNFEKDKRDQLFRFQQSVLLAEFAQLQESIRHYDHILFLVKGWSITVSGGLVVLAVQQERASIALFALGIIPMFWLIETLAKMVQ